MLFDFTILCYLSSVIILSGVLRNLYLKMVTKSCKSKVCLIGKTVIVTGANTGIGYETALECAKRGARVILACRNETKGSAAVTKIKELTKNYNVALKILDLSSMQSVKMFVDDVLENEKSLDILINNAGALGLHNTITDDGLQLEWQTNYFGPVLLTLLLSELLKKSSPSRVVNVSSVMAKFANLSTKTLNSGENIYNNSKLAIILFTKELAKRLEAHNVSVFTLHPGVIATDIFTQRIPIAPLRDSVNFLMGFLFLSSQEGARTTLHAALEQGIEHYTGRHFENCRVQKDYRIAKDSELAKDIWNETLRLINFNENRIL